MEIINVSKEIKQTETISIEIENVKNCYLKGNDNLNGIINYLGIWTDKQGLKIIEIRNQRMVGIDFCSNKSVYTYPDIERFMKNNNKVEVIPKKIFRKELDRIINALKENN